MDTFQDDNPFPPAHAHADAGADAQHRRHGFAAPGCHTLGCRMKSLRRVAPWQTSRRAAARIIASGMAFPSGSCTLRRRGRI